MPCFRSACLLIVLVIGAADPLYRAALTQVTEASGNARVEVVESSEELRETLQQKPELRFGAVRVAALTITVDDAVRFQAIDGFGASLTDSSAWLLTHKLSESQRSRKCVLHRSVGAARAYAALLVPDGLLFRRVLLGQPGAEKQRHTNGLYCGCAEKIPRLVDREDGIRPQVRGLIQQASSHKVGEEGSR